MQRDPALEEHGVIGFERLLDLLVEVGLDAVANIKLGDVFVAEEVKVRLCGFGFGEFSVNFVPILAVADAVFAAVDKHKAPVAFWNVDGCRFVGRHDDAFVAVESDGVAPFCFKGASGCSDER